LRGLGELLLLSLAIVNTMSDLSQIEYDLSHDHVMLNSFMFNEQIASKRYRFIDCEAFLHQDHLRVVSFQMLPENQYSAISYVWTGLKPGHCDDKSLFSIVGIRDARPLNWDILLCACKLSLSKGCPLLWLDLICIQQLDDVDRVWQTTHMGEIYEKCGFGIIIPGGLQRLVYPLWKERTK
jgi:hypothetical protein